jgi:DNA-binding transcriptional LysR family regulator
MEYHVACDNLDEIGMIIELKRIIAGSNGPPHQPDRLRAGRRQWRLFRRRAQAQHVHHHGEQPHPGARTAIGRTPAQSHDAVSVTEIGRAYYDRCVQILADIEQADDIAGALQSTPRGTLRIHTPTHMVPFVAPVVNAFLGLYPDVKVDVTIGERNVDMIDEGFDLAVRMLRPPDSSLIVRNLATWRHVLCCSHGYLEKHGRPQQLAELAERNCIRHVSYPFGEEWRFVDRMGTPASVRVSGNLVTNSGETLHQAAREGVGVCLAAGFLIRDDLEAGRLVRLLPEYRPVEF